MRRHEFEYSAEPKRQRATEEEGGVLAKSTDTSLYHHSLSAKVSLVPQSWTSTIGDLSSKISAALRTWPSLCIINALATLEATTCKQSYSPFSQMINSQAI